MLFREYNQLQFSIKYRSSPNSVSAFALMHARERALVHVAPDQNTCLRQMLFIYYSLVFAICVHYARNASRS